MGQVKIPTLYDKKKSITPFLNWTFPESEKKHLCL